MKAKKRRQGRGGKVEDKGKDEFWKIIEEGICYLSRDFHKSGVVIKSEEIKALFNKLRTLHGT